MPVGTAIGLGPGDTVLDGDAAPHGKEQTSPHFRPMTIVATSPISATVEMFIYFIEE